MARPIAPDTVARRDDDLDPNGPIPVGMKRTRSGRLKRRNILWRLRKVLLGLVVVAVLSSSGGAYTVWSRVDLPKPPEPLQKSYLCPITVGSDRGCDANTAFAEVGKGDAGIPVTRQEIPDVFVKALVAAEDKDFYNHSGVDPTGIAGALYRDLRGGAQQGGSTITQQYIKNAYDDDAPTVSRKIKEAVQAIKLEQKYGKDEILTRYLNEIYFGRNARGLGAAVRAYFGDKAQVKDLTLEMAAYLAAIIREPEFADANRNKAADPLYEKQKTYATVRRAQVLDAMVAQGYITDDERNRAAATAIDSYVTVRGADVQGAVRPDAVQVGGRYWQNFIEEWLAANTRGEVTKEALRTKGYRVYTTFDPDMQRIAYEAVDEVLKQPSEANTAMAVIDEKGFIRAMVGGRDRLGMGSNYATQAKRNPGSAFKPIALAAYLNQPGKSLADKFPNPLCLELPKEPKLCSIKGDETRDPIDLVHAAAISSNTVFGKLQLEMGNTKTLDLARAMGIPEGAYTMPDATGSARLALGTIVSLAPLDMATAFSVFPRQGEQIGPYPVLRVTDARGRIIWDAPQKHERVLQPDVVDQVNYALTQVLDDRKGTGHTETRAMNQTAGMVAGKTGTMAYEEKGKPPSQESTDAWFVGYNCRITAAVWMGDPKGHVPMNQVEDVRFVNGGTLPARIFSHFMTKAMFLLPPCAGPYKRPKGAEPPPPPPTQPTAPKRGDDDGGKEDGGRPEPDNRWWTWPWATTTTVAPELPTTTRREQRPTTTRRRGPGAQPAEPPPADVDAATTPEDPRAGRASP